MCSFFLRMFMPGLQIQKNRAMNFRVDGCGGMAHIGVLRTLFSQLWRGTVPRTLSFVVPCTPSGRLSLLFPSPHFFSVSLPPLYNLAKPTHQVRRLNLTVTKVT